MWKHGKSRLEVLVHNVDTGNEDRRTGVFTTLGNRGPNAEISIGGDQDRLDLALPCQIDAFFNQEPIPVAGGRYTGAAIGELGPLTSR
jgi:hypothetical protein